MPFRINNPEFITYCNYLRDRSFDEVSETDNDWSASEAYTEGIHGHSVASIASNITINAGTTGIKAGNQISISFIAKIDTAQAAQNFWFNDANGRVATASLFYNNGNIYWDCGVDAVTYDRINTAYPSDGLGNWRHWVLTKNASTGIMQVIYEGDLFYSDSGKTKAITVPTAGYIGYTTGFAQSVGNFKIHNCEFTLDECRELMIMDKL